MQFSAAWSPAAWIGLGFWYVHFKAGDTLEKAGGRDEDYVAVSSTLHF